MKGLINESNEHSNTKGSEVINDSVKGRKHSNSPDTY